jgi:arginine repressor
MPTRPRRQQRLRQLLTDRDLHSQAEVARRWPRPASRSTRPPSAATSARSARSRSAAPTAAGLPPGGRPRPVRGAHRLDETLQRFVTHVTSSGNLAVLRTPPACAHPVASAIDLAELDGVIATVSGDDTVLVVAEEGTTGAELAGRPAAPRRLTPPRPTHGTDDPGPLTAPHLRPTRTTDPTEPTQHPDSHEHAPRRPAGAPMSKPRIVLAYSGGLDTSVAIQWMKEHKDVEVVACAVDVGQGVDDLDEIRSARWTAARSSPSSSTPATSSPTDFIAPALKANAMYMGKYPLVSALSRPLIVKHLVGVRPRDRRRRRHRPRLHRQGQRPGPLRGRRDVPGPRPRGDGPDPRVGADPRRRDRLRRRAGHPDPGR